MNRNPKILLGLLTAGLLVFIVTSCGDDGVTDAPCTNCGFWEMAYGGVGRFPAASPDPAIIAFVSKYQLPEKIEYPFDPLDLGMDQYYHVWLARTEDFSDTVWYYQVTSETRNDFNPAWSPDGDLIAFERNIGQEEERQVFVVDVTDPASPGIPQQVTDGDLKPPAATGGSYRNTNPSWVSLGEKSYLSFVNFPEGSGDFDIGLLSWDDLAETVWVSIDPADLAADENGVMSFVFRDQQASSNGSRFLTFSSPDRRRVGDIRVVAATEEQPDSSVVADIFINGKPSGKVTPYTFRYRPAGIRIRISSTIEGYCSEAGDSLVPLPDTTNVFLIDFRHTRGTLGVSASKPDLFIYMNGEELVDNTGLALRTLDNNEYIYIKCVLPDTLHRLYTEDVFGRICGDTVAVDVAPGETTFVDFECGTSTVSSRGGARTPNLVGGFRRGRDVGSEISLLTQQERRGIWIVDTGGTPDVSDDLMYQLDPGSRGANSPVLSHDGNYVAYFRGEYTSWEIVVADVSGLLSGTGDPDLHIVGLPGSTEDFECWRKPEKISWLPTQDGAKIVVSLSPCRGGLPDDFRIWVADLSRFVD